MFDYVVTAVITFGLAYSFSGTDGPFGLFARLRKLVTDRYPEDTWQNTGIQCVICCGFWIGIPVAYFMDTGVCGWLFAFGLLNIVTSVSPD
jgi:hypothetical protein